MKEFYYQGRKSTSDWKLERFCPQNRIMSLPIARQQWMTAKWPVSSWQLIPNDLFPTGNREETVLTNFTNVLDKTKLISQCFAC